MSTEWLSRALEESRARGFLGPGSIEPQIEHANGFAHCWEEIHDSPPLNFLDLGSGGGLPGLVLLERWDCRGVLLDSMTKRTKFLEEVSHWNGAPGQLEVVTGRAEEIARETSFDGAFHLVTARSFGPPSVVAECAIRFLKIDGILAVSEPPDDDDDLRWSREGPQELGYEDLGRVRYGAAFRVLIKRRTTSATFPRDVGIPKKRPLF